MRIVFATRNEGKLRELTQMLASTGVELVSLNDFSSLPEVVEDGKTYLENALKSQDHCGGDRANSAGGRFRSGGGSARREPGIYSARYAGEDASDEENNALLLTKLKDVPLSERRSSFCCVLVLYSPGGGYQAFEGRWDGLIIDESRGTNGFGYDPIFLWPDMNKTAAELPPEVKNKISHRGRALAKLKEYLDGESPAGTVGA